MRRLTFLVVFFSLVLSACGSGGGTSESTASIEDPSTTTIQDSDTSSTDGSPGTTVGPNETTTTSGRPVAPDFTLELGDGGSYTLSEAANPVYLVFWAEW